MIRDINYGINKVIEESDGVAYVSCSKIYSFAIVNNGTGKRKYFKTKTNFIKGAHEELDRETIS